LDRVSPHPEPELGTANALNPITNALQTLIQNYHLTTNNNE